MARSSRRAGGYHAIMGGRRKRMVAAAIVTPPLTPSPTLSFSVVAISVPEGNSGSTTVPNVLNVVRDGVTGPLLVNLSAGGTASAGSDYLALPATVLVPAGESSASFDLVVNGDSASEANETIVISAALADYPGATALKVVTILDDDAGGGPITTPPVVLQPGARIVSATDSKGGDISSPLMRNFVRAAIERGNGRWRWALGGDQGIGGNVITDTDNNAYNDLAHRLGYTTAQLADVTVVAIGHNSMSAATSQTIGELQALHNSLRAGLGANRYILWTTVLPSIDTNNPANLYPVDSAKLIQVNDAIMALHGTDAGYTRAINFTYRSTDNGGAVFNPLTMCYDEPVPSAGQRIHPNSLGADFVGALLAGALDQLVAPQTYAQALADTGAAREHGANVTVAAVYGMTGTGGTVAGTGSASVSGDIASAFTLTNASTATVVCSRIDKGDGTFRQRVVITGTGLAEGHVLFGTTNTSATRPAIGAVYGDVVETLIGVNRITAADGVAAPTGLRQEGLTQPTSNASYSRGRPDTVENNIVPQAAAIGSRIHRAYERMQLTALNTLLPSFGVRFSGDVSIMFEVEGLIVRKTDLVAYAPAKYMGDDAVMGAAQRIGPFGGGMTAVGDGTFRVTANATAALVGGYVSGGGSITRSDIKVYQSESDVVGDGTLLATVPIGSNYTWGPAGTKHRLEATVQGTIGIAQTYRSPTLVSA